MGLRAGLGLGFTLGGQLRRALRRQLGRRRIAVRLALGVRSDGAHLQGRRRWVTVDGSHGASPRGHARGDIAAGACHTGPDGSGRGADRARNLDGRPERASIGRTLGRHGSRGSRADPDRPGGSDYASHRSGRGPAHGGFAPGSPVGWRARNHGPAEHPHSPDDPHAHHPVDALGRSGTDTERGRRTHAGRSVDSRGIAPDGGNHHSSDGDAHQPRSHDSFGGRGPVAFDDPVDPELGADAEFCHALAQRSDNPLRADALVDYAVDAFGSDALVDESPDADGSDAQQWYDQPVGADAQQRRGHPHGADPQQWWGSDSHGADAQ